MPKPYSWIELTNGHFYSYNSDFRPVKFRDKDFNELDENFEPTGRKIVEMPECEGCSKLDSFVKAEALLEAASQPDASPEIIAEAELVGYVEPASPTKPERQKRSRVRD